MEAERRSTMSSLKGQLSNVEGSVKSMKAAVVVGSVLTVACLAAVFGVTVAANEVSKEVKVNNGVLATKAGKSVLTTNMVATSKVAPEMQKVTLSAEEVAMTFVVNAQVTEGTTTTVIVDDAILTYTNGEMSAFDISEGSVLESVLSTDEAEKRSASTRGKIAKGIRKRYATIDGWVTRGLIYAETGIKVGIGFAGCYYFDWCDRR